MSLRRRPAATDSGGPYFPINVLPFGLQGDILYLWASFRLRSRPLQVVVWVALLGLATYAISHYGQIYIVPSLINGASSIPWREARQVLLLAAGALFSSLNILATLSLVWIWRGLRRLDSEGHLESLQMVPVRLRPSPLFYAMATRYLPLSFMAILVEYLSPTRSPFRDYPFVDYPNPIPAEAIYWAAAQQVSILAYCTVNLMADLALGFWLFCRVSLSYSTLIFALVCVGVIEPVVVMTLQRWLDVRFTIPYSVYGEMYGLVATSRFYFSGAAISLVVWLILLGELERHWGRLLRSPRFDPILLRARFWKNDGGD